MTETKVEDRPEVRVEVVEHPASKGEMVPVERDQRLQTLQSGIGGVRFESMLQVMEFAKLMAKAGSALPPHLRDNPGGCLAAIIKAMEWDFSPFTVANWQYEVEQKGGTKRVAYESQCYHAVIEARAPIKERLRYEILGENDERRCRIWFTIKGEDKPREFVTETLGRLKANGRSPLWTAKPEVQMFYNASRDVARIYFPDIFGGVYTREEIEEFREQRAIDVSPDNGSALHERLKAAAANGDGEGGEGFSQDTGEELLQETLRRATDTKPRAPRKAAAKKVAEEPAEQTATTEAAKPAAGPSAEVHADGKPEWTGKQAQGPHPRPAPKNLKQYRQWVADWLQDHEDADEIETRWAGKAERDLRNKCGLTSEDKAEVRKLVDERVATLEAQQ